VGIIVKTLQSALRQAQDDRLCVQDERLWAQDEYLLFKKTSSAYRCAPTVLKKMKTNKFSIM